MVTSCCAFGCTNRYQKNKGVTRGFYRFPFSRPLLVKKWVLATKRRNWQPTQYSCLCDDHFTEDCFKTGSKGRYLKRDAVPSIFSFPPHLQKWSKKQEIQKVPLKHNEEGSVKSPIIIKDIQCIPSSSSLSDQQLNLQEQSSSPTENAQHTSSFSLGSQQLNTSSQEENLIISGNIQSTSSNSLLNNQQIILSSGMSLTTENIQSSSHNFSLSNQQPLPSSEQKSTTIPINNSNLQGVFSGFLLSEQNMIINILREPHSVSTNFNQISPQHLILKQPLSSSLTKKHQKSKVTLLREKIRSMQRDIDQRNEKILKLEKMLDLALKYIGMPLKIEDLLRDESVLQCLL